MSDKMTLAEFGQTVKAKHPDYASYSDEEIGQRMLQKYPEYASRVDTEPQVDLNHVVAAGPGVTDNRSWPEVAVDQTLNAGKGVLSAVTGIPDMISGAAGAVKDLVTGHGAKAGSMISGLVHSYYDPVATSLRGTGALAEAHGLLPPNSVTPPSRQDWETAAQDAGMQAGGILVGKGIKSIPTSAEGIQGVANKLRSIKQATGAKIGGAAGAAVGAGVGGPIGSAVGAGVGGAAGTAIIPAIADGAASLVERLAKARAKFDSARAVQDNPAAPARAVEPTPELQQLGQQMDRPYAMETRQPGTPNGPIEPTPELQQLGQQMDRPYAMDTRQPGASNGPMEPTPELQQLQQQMGQENAPNLETRQPGVSNGPIEPSPELQQLGQQMSQPVAHPDAGVVAPRHIQMAREAILQDGASRSTANLLKVSRNVPELLKTAPELAGIPAGPNFNAKLFNAFNRVGHELNATEASIPDTTMVPTENAVSQLTNLEAKYIDTNQPGAVRAIDKVKSFLAERPSMSWGEFIKAKRAFFNEINLSSAAGREAYQVFKKLSNDVSPELGKLNQQYYTVKSAMENAAMDIKSGEKIRTIGKSKNPKSIKPDDSGDRPLRAPL